NTRLQKLQDDRKAKTAQFLKIKGSREALDRFRERDRQEHIREQLRIEQKALDERARIAFVRGQKETINSP
ncbi:MAG: flagellar FliJ family protein, partial [Planctomycetota bacterium]